ncbi:MAG: HEAT repeat domain-containing protein [Cyanobacteriota bacterium]
MPPTLSAAGAAALLVVLWLLGRPRPRLSSRQDTAAVAALNREQIVRVLRPEPEAEPKAPAVLIEPVLPLPRTAAERHRFLRQLERWSRGSDSDRLRAMQASGRWGQRAVLPLLRRGRHDPDPRVALAAAQALERFRGRSAAPGGLQALTAPRNVSRTR